MHTMYFGTHDYQTFMFHEQASKFGQVQILKNFENLSIWGFMGVFGGIWICNTDNSRKFGFL